MPRSLYSLRYDRFRSLLVEARRQSGLTQIEVAEKLRRPQSFVSKYEQGERRLDVVEFLDVAKAIGANPHSILHQIEQRSFGNSEAADGESGI